MLNINYDIIMENKSFAEVAAMWLLDKKPYIKQSTYCAYVLLLKNHILPAFAEVGQVTEEFVQTFVLEKLEHRLSQRTVKDMVMVLTMVLRYAVKHGYMLPFDMDIKYPQNQRVKGLDVFGIEEQKSIVKYVQTHFSFKSLGIYICLCTGLRIGEICALVWDDIDTQYGVIRVSKTIQRIYVVDGEDKYTKVIIDTPKSRNSSREVPIPKDLLDLISSLKNMVNGKSYVLTNTSHPIEPRAYRNYYNRLMKQLSLPPLKFHGLRHTFATRCIECKCDYKTVSMLMGHSNISTTLNLYVHPDLEQKRRCVQLVYDTFL